MTPPDSLTLSPIAHARGTVRLPGSKSISNRALLLSALASGTTHLTGLLKADDTDRMIESLVRLGVKIEGDAKFLSVTGTGGTFPVKSADLFIGNAGTAARTLTAALAFAGGSYRLDGIGRMRERPIGDLVDALTMLGAKIRYEGRAGYPPLRFEPACAAADRVRVKGNVSSQFLTALLLVAPTIAPSNGLSVEVEGELISRPYIDLTLGMMADFGVHVTEESGVFHVPQGRYLAQERYAVEGDASGASYFLALGALTGGPVRVEGVGKNSRQGDIAFADVLEKMGATVVRGENFIEVSRKSGVPLSGITVDCTKIPDAAMTLVPMALMADGPVHLTGIASWRVKETDRIAAMAAEMKKFGARVTEGADYLICEKGEEVLDAAVATYDDHRMAMSLSLAAACGAQVTVLNPGCTAKTFPTYFDELAKLTGQDGFAPGGGA